MSNSSETYWVEVKKSLLLDAGWGLFTFCIFNKSEGNCRKTSLVFLFNPYEKNDEDYDYLIKIYVGNYKQKFNCNVSVSIHFDMGTQFFNNTNRVNKFSKRGKYKNNTRFEGLTLYANTNIRIGDEIKVDYVNIFIEKKYV